MGNMFLSALISGPCVVKNGFDAFCNFCIAVMTALAKSWDQDCYECNCRV